MSGGDLETELDHELRAERAMLEHARRCLDAMRRRAESLTSSSGGDWVSEEVLHWRIQQRIASLADDGSSGLFFGRIDYDDSAELPDTRFYLGRRHVVDDLGDPVVIDWRARLAHPFYRATPRNRFGVRLRRRFGYQRGALTSFQDEPLWLGEDDGTADRLLAAEIERPRIGPMRDIVATIQPEQDDLIRAPLEQTIVVQGGPGTGKTAVGLHRIAYLLYEHRARLERDGVLMVGPSAAYLAFIHDVLPGLGEVRVEQRSLAGLVPGVRPTGTEPPRVAEVKAGARMAEVVRRAVFRHVRWPGEPLRLRWSSRVIEIPAQALRQEVAALLARGVRYHIGRAQLRQWLLDRCYQHLVSTDALSALDSARDVDRAISGSAELRRFMDRTWPALQPAQMVYRLLGDRAALAEAAAGILDEREQALLLRPRRRGGFRQMAWSMEDLYLIDEAIDVIDGTRTYGHVVADEAQDLSPMQLRAVGRRCRYGSATVLGDLAQGTSPWAAVGWEEALPHLGKTEPRMEALPRAFRVPRQVLDFANQLLPSIAPQVTPAVSVRSVPGSLELRASTPERRTREWLLALRRALDAEGSVGLIGADPKIPELRAALERESLDFRMVERFDLSTRLSLVPASTVKGLEFDQVVLVEPADVVDADRHGLRRLYIALTRAVSHLCVVHARPLPDPLLGGAAA
ncbi:MAG TPA: UvrD-helicase domain-containing protein [Actinomycetes bacterium]